MFFVLLRADRYTGILETDSGFELFPINGALQLQHFPRLLFARRRYARRRSSTSKGKLQQTCNDHGSAHNDHIGGSWRRQAKDQCQKAQSQQKHAICQKRQRKGFQRHNYLCRSRKEIKYRTGNRSIRCVFLDRLRAALFRVALF